MKITRIASILLLGTLLVSGFACDGGGEPATKIVERYIEASADDCERQTGEAEAFGTDILWGRAGASLWEGDQLYYATGMRWLNITIPQGSTIETAKITVTCRYTRNTTCHTIFEGEDNDNAAIFSTKEDYDARDRTDGTGVEGDGSVEWHNIPAWTKDLPYDSPDLKNIIQEIVNREGWESGHALVIFWSDDGSPTGEIAHSRECYSYDDATDKTFKLYIEYTAAHTKTVSMDTLLRQLDTETVSIDAYLKAEAEQTAAELDTLRAFRDEVLLQNGLGSQFVALYYEISPPVADFISEHGPMRMLVRELLVAPVVWVVEATEALWRN